MQPFTLVIQKTSHRIFFCPLVIFLCLALLLCKTSFAENTISNDFEPGNNLRDQSDILSISNAPITRIEYCNLLYQMLKDLGRHPLAEKNVFEDCQTSFISALYSVGIVCGNDKKLFLPDNHISQEEVMTFLSRTMSWLGLDLGTMADEVISNDTISPWAAPHIQTVYHAGLLEGDIAQFEPCSTMSGRIAYQGITNLYDYAVDQLNVIHAPKIIGTYALRQVQFLHVETAKSFTYSGDMLPIINNHFVSYLHQNNDIIISYLYAKDTDTSVIINYSTDNKILGNVRLADIWGEKYKDYYIAIIQDLVTNVYYFNSNESVSLQYWPSGNPYGPLSTELPSSITNDKYLPGFQFTLLEDMLMKFNLPQFLSRQTAGDGSLEPVAGVMTERTQ